MAYKKKLFDPQSSEPFAISRSKVDSFIKCARCFYLDRRLGIGQPDIIPRFSLNLAVDELLKTEFDIYRKQQIAYPKFKEWGIEHLVPFEHDEMDTWRNSFVGMRYLHKETNLELFGGVDEIFYDPKTEEIFVADYNMIFV